MSDRTRDDVMVELAPITAAKWKAVNAQEFAQAADLRDKERALQQELHRLGGPPPGLFRVRVDRPDGSYHVGEGPSLPSLIEGLGDIIIVTREVVGVLDAVDALAKRVGRAASPRSQP